MRRLRSADDKVSKNLMPASMEVLQAVVADSRVVEFVAGAFERLGVDVRDTGEAFTCVHRGDRIDFEDRIVHGQVDYTVEVESGQLERLGAQVRAGTFDKAEKFRIVRVLFTPATAAMLADQPVLSHPLVRRLAGVENLLHVRLVAPVRDEEDGTHTLIYAAGQWLVFPGWHGRARRTFTLSTEEALQYQRRVFATVRAQAFGEWLRFGRWYRQWRQGVSRRDPVRA